MGEFPTETRAEMERMMSHGIEPSEKTYKWVMHSHEVIGNVEEVKRLIEESRGRGLEVTRYYVSSLIGAYVKRCLYIYSVYMYIYVCACV